MKFSEWYRRRKKKDSCYHKVKSRYKVWPSAYSSGALVRCRKVGAKNWGKSKKNHMLKESLKNSQQYVDAANAIMALYYNGSDASLMSVPEIIHALSSLGKAPPENTPAHLFAARIKSIARQGTVVDDFS